MIVVCMTEQERSYSKSSIGVWTMINFPCKDCITLARCKSRIMSSDDHQIQFQNAVAHSVMCPLFEKFVKGIKERYDPDAYVKLEYSLRFFRGESLEPLNRKPLTKEVIDFFKTVCLTILKNGKVRIGVCHESETKEVQTKKL